MICVSSVYVYPGSVTLKTGEWYYGAWAEVCPTYATCREVRWYSSNTNVASVNATTGYIYARGTGTARIYAQATDGSGRSDYLNVYVTSSSIKVSYVELNRSVLYLEKNETYTLSATVCPYNASNKTLNWSSSNGNVATVSGGKITAKGNGYASIRATAADGSGACDCCDVYVTGNTLVTSVSVSPSSKTMTAGSSAYLYETVCPTNATNKCVMWSSSNSGVVSVNPTSGLIYAQKAGTARIYATAQDGSGKQGYCTVTVMAPIKVTSIEVCPTTETMNVGETAYLNVTVYPYNATNKRITWCSSNEDVACVDYYTGQIYANEVGTTVITATSVDGSYTSSSIITVYSTDPFHHSNIEYLRIKKYDRTAYGGDGDITTIVTKSVLNNETYFEAFAADRSSVAFKIDNSLKNELRQQESLFQSTAIMFTVPFYIHLAKLGVDEMASNGIIENEGPEYYGIWASESNRLLLEANKISNQIQLTLAVVTLVYSIYNIVSAIKTAKMSLNTTKTFDSISYKATVSEADNLFNELSANGTKYTKENTMWIVRKYDGSICWLESGNTSAGFKHILNRHPVSEFSSFNVSSEVGLSSLIYNTVSTQAPIGTYGSGGLVYSFGNQKYLNIVISNNGYIVDAYNVSNSISGIVFY